MALTTDQKSSKVFKKWIGVGESSTARQFFEEPYRGRALVLPDQVWQQASLIPVPAAVLPGITEQHVDLSLTPVAGTTNAFYHANLVDAIPFNYGDGSYNYTLKDSLDNPIFFGQGDWVVDAEAGLLTFYGAVPANMPPKISFYKYIGTKGVGGGGGGTPGGVDTNIQYNSAGSFAGSNLFIYDYGVNRVTMVDAVPDTRYEIELDGPSGKVSGNQVEVSPFIYDNSAPSIAINLPFLESSPNGFLYARNQYGENAFSVKHDEPTSTSSISFLATSALRKVTVDTPPIGYGVRTDGLGLSYFGVPYNAALEPTRLTVMLWMQGSGSIERVFACHGVDGGALKWKLWQDAAGSAHATVSGSFGTVDVSDAYFIADNLAHLLSLTFDGLSVTLKVDNRLGVTSPAVGTLNDVSGDAPPLLFAVDVDEVSNNYMGGMLDEIAFYGEALPTNILDSFYGAGPGYSRYHRTNEPDLVGLWNFDNLFDGFSGFGDRTGSGLDATIQVGILVLDDMFSTSIAIGPPDTFSEIDVVKVSPPYYEPYVGTIELGNSVSETYLHGYDVRLNCQNGGAIWASGGDLVFVHNPLGIPPDVEPRIRGSESNQPLIIQSSGIALGESPLATGLVTLGYAPNAETTTHIENSSGDTRIVTIWPFYNQDPIGNAGSTDLYISRRVDSLGQGRHSFLELVNRVWIPIRPAHEASRPQFGISAPTDYDYNTRLQWTDGYTNFYDIGIQRDYVTGLLAITDAESYTDFSSLMLMDLVASNVFSHDYQQQLAFYRQTTGSIISITDYGLGRILVETVDPHKLGNYSTVYITGTTSYNGTFKVYILSEYQFYVYATYVADEVAGAFDGVSSDSYVDQEHRLALISYESTSSVLSIQEQGNNGISLSVPSIDSMPNRYGSPEYDYPGFKFYDKPMGFSQLTKAVPATSVPLIGAMSFNGVDQWMAQRGSTSSFATRYQTIELWFKGTYTADSTLIARRDTQTAGPYEAWHVRFTSANDIEVLAWDTTSTQITLNANVTGILDGTTWHHILVTFGETYATLYVDGVEVDQAAWATPGGLFYAQATMSLDIGAWSHSEDNWPPWPADPQEYFEGSVDEIRIYNRELSSREVEVRYGNGAGWYGFTRDYGLIGGWHLDNDANGYSPAGMAIDFLFGTPSFAAGKVPEADTTATPDFNVFNTTVAAVPDSADEGAVVTFGDKFARTIIKGNYNSSLEFGTTTGIMTVDHARNDVFRFEPGASSQNFKVMTPDYAMGGDLTFEATGGLVGDGAFMFDDDMYVTGSLHLDTIANGFLTPRLTTVERDAIITPQVGVMIFNTTETRHEFFDGLLWQPIGGGTSTAAVDVTVDTSNFEFLSPSSTDQQLVDDEVDNIFMQMIPKPPLLSTFSMALSSAYSALEATTGTLHNNIVTVDTTPDSAVVTGFYKGIAGDVLTAMVDAADSGNRTLTAGSDVGTYTDLVILTDYDPYAGEVPPIRVGFWRALDARISLNVGSLLVGSHTFQLTHSGESGNTGIFTFYVDDPVNTTISGTSYTFGTYGEHDLSGVPSLNGGSEINANFTVNNAVQTHYHTTRIAVVSSTFTTSANAQPVAPPNPGDPVAFTNILVTTNVSAYSENITLAVTGYSSNNAAGTPGSIPTSARIDTSSEATRVESGSGQFPAAGYGGAYDSAEVLNLSGGYPEELQMLNSRYQWPPSVNYSANLPTAGPDYSTDMGTGDRWVTFQPTTLTNASAFTITFNGIQGTWTGTETTGIQVYAKVEGATGWLDANTAYPGVGDPVADDDPAMVFGSSSNVIKRVTFGTVTRSGLLYVRIGLPFGSDKKFTSITISGIV